MELAVSRVVAVETATEAALLLSAVGGIPHAAARVRTGVGINTGLQAQRMDAVDDRLHSVREALGVELEDPVLAMTPEEAVVDVDVDVAGVLEPVRRHRTRRLEDDLLGNLDAERVPARPPHKRANLRVARRRDLRGVEKLSRTRGYNLLVGALKTTQVDIGLARGEIDADALVAFGAIAVFDPLVYSGDLRSDFLAKRRIRTDSGGH